MAFEIQHNLVLQKFTPTKRVDGAVTTMEVNVGGSFAVKHAGRLNRFTTATYVQHFTIKDAGPEALPGQPDHPGSTPRHGGQEAVTQQIPLTLRLFTPDGRPFTGAEVTRADLDRLRDLRGEPLGPWSFTLTGAVTVDADGTAPIEPKGFVQLDLLEQVPNDSAAPLVSGALVPIQGQSFSFDLNREGTFVAEVTVPAGRAPWTGQLKLVDPDGATAAQVSGPLLTFEVGLRTLQKSRDRAGAVRPWRLEASPRGTAATTPHLTATVVARGRVKLAAVRARVDALLGPHGSFIELFGENKDGRARARLRVTDVVAAETLDMYQLLDKPLSSAAQDDGVDPKDFRANVTYTLVDKPEDRGSGLKLDVSTLKLTGIDVALGAGVALGSAVPALRLGVGISGEARITFQGLVLAHASLRGGRFDMEVGLKLAADGTPQVVVSVPSSPFDIGINLATKAALVAVLGPLGLIGGLGVTEFIESEINVAFSRAARDLFADPTLAPRILMTIFGGHFTYKSFTIEGDELHFNHLAPLEPDPKPSPSYHGAIGRGLNAVTADGLPFVPPTLGDTWSAVNLQKNIKHVVVVMMENRSYDHVLGWRARPPRSEAADGLTDELVKAAEAAPGGPWDVRPLSQAGFARNAIGKMTRLPKDVGHNLKDVTQQLSLRAPGPAGGGVINSPQGFVENFAHRLESEPLGVEPRDVLGFYDGEDLPFFDYLAQNYAYCDRYFSSHPGPTLPNRMFSLTGDVQRDRYGFPILSNNDGDNFLLSRAMTIYDLLEREGVGYRVYESMPSVTMLRMFARYASDITNIVPLSRLKEDVAGGDLPAFTVIEPQMHAHPEDDDHPDADMYRGQIFLKTVYDTLRSNAALWRQTLLIITYDEHGGFYDHVVPPAADVYRLPSVVGPAIGTVAPVAAGIHAPASADTTATVHFSPTHVAPGLSDASIVFPGGGTPTPTATSLNVSYGLRVPTFVVSPWTAPGKGPPLVLDHCSILKTVLACFLGGKKPFLSDRVSASQSFEAFLTQTEPRTDVPVSPALPELPKDVRRLVGTSQIVTPPVSRRELREGSIDYHQLTGFWARQLGR